MSCPTSPTCSPEAIWHELKRQLYISVASWNWRLDIANTAACEIWGSDTAELTNRTAPFSTTIEPIDCLTMFASNSSLAKSCEVCDKKSVNDKLTASSTRFNGDASLASKKSVGSRNEAVNSGRRGMDMIPGDGRSNHSEKSEGTIESSTASRDTDIPETDGIFDETRDESGLNSDGLFAVELSPTVVRKADRCACGTNVSFFIAASKISLASSLSSLWSPSSSSS